MKFWRTIQKIIDTNAEFKVDYHTWLWSQGKKKQQIIEMYIKGHNKIEIASALRINPLKVNKDINEAQRSLERRIKHGH